MNSGTPLPAFFSVQTKAARRMRSSKRARPTRTPRSDKSPSVKAHQRRPTVKVEIET